MQQTRRPSQPNQSSVGLERAERASQGAVSFGLSRNEQMAQNKTDKMRGHRMRRVKPVLTR